VSQNEALAKHLLFGSDAPVFDDIPENSPSFFKHSFVRRHPVHIETEAKRFHPNQLLRRL